MLERRPRLALIDEYAHTNARGSRHPKRWQDIEELRDAGIDVFTTLNIQHVESLNDIVASFTKVRVRETVPDFLLDDAELEIVDLPPNELIDRLEQGKDTKTLTASDWQFHPGPGGSPTAVRDDQGIGRAGL